jgi:hypothetical protein
MKNQQDQKLKELQAKVTASFNKMKTCAITDIQKIALEYQKAQEELSEYEDSLITPEEREAQRIYDDALEKYEAAKIAFEESKAKIMEVFPSYIKVKKQSSGDSNHTSNKLSYDDCQEIRRLFSTGVKAKDIAEKFDITPAVVMYKVHYLQGKLKKGDTAYTPLINKFYPKKWIDKSGVERSGAPLLEDNVKEDNTRYKGYKAI